MVLSMQQRASSTLLSLFAISSLLSMAQAKYDNTFNRNFNFVDWCKGQYVCKHESDGSVAISAHWNKMGAFISHSYYHYGIFSARIKMPSGYSGGTIPCLYLISGGNPGYKDIHDEIDFEFLGGKTPGEMIMHTNLISGGQNFLEQFRFPFDPSAAWHTYKIIYSPNFVAWVVDDTPIRITWRQTGKPFPTKPMRVKASIWDASSWSPLRTNWNLGQVTVQFRDFELWQTCPVPRSGAKPACVWERNAARAPWLRTFPKWQMDKSAAFRRQYTKAAYGWKHIH